MSLVLVHPSVVDADSGVGVQGSRRSRSRIANCCVDSDSSVANGRRVPVDNGRRVPVDTGSRVPVDTGGRIPVGRS